MLADMINTVIQGDSLEVMRQLPDASIDMIACDLPYGITACDWDVRIPFEPLWEAYKRIIKPNGAIVLTASQPFTSMLVMSNLKMFKYEWIWEKNCGSNFMNQKNAPSKEHENILIFAKGKTNYNPIRIMRSDKSLQRHPINKVGIIKPCKIGKMGRHIALDKIQPIHYMAKDGTRVPKDVLKFDIENNGLHPTQKPVALFNYLIRTYTNEGDLVLDNCAGSGTTCVAAKQTGRRFIGIEQSAEYCAIARKRLLQEELF